MSGLNMSVWAEPDGRAFMRLNDFTVAFESPEELQQFAAGLSQNAEHVAKAYAIYRSQQTGQ